MPSHLTDRLQTSRRQQFTGRNDELEQFEEALDAPEWPFHVLYVHGPGGVGKTTLLHAFRRRCDEHDVPCHRVDARELSPSVSALTDALEGALAAPPTRAGLSELSERHDRLVLMIDTYEQLASLDHWVRETFVPRLPTSALLVLSGRQEHAAEWHADPGLRALVRFMPLRNLSRSESRRYLDEREVPPSQQEDVLAFAHGHPLALALAADASDQDPDLKFEAAQSPDLVGSLVKRFMDEVPSTRHRMAAEACAMVRSATEPLLAALLQQENAHDMFEWLRSLSFVETSREGLIPHDLARKVIVSDLRWRDAERHQGLRTRARKYYTAQLQSSNTQAPERVLFDYLFLLRDQPIVRPFFQELQAQKSDDAQYVQDQPHDDDWPDLRAMVARHEGEEAAQLFDYWRERQPDVLRLFRDGEGQPVGFVWPLALHEIGESERERDPAVRVAWNHLRDEAPLREKERATLFRFWMAEDTYQDVSPVQGLIFAHTVRHYLTTDRLGFSFLCCASPDQWALPLAYADFELLDDASFELDGTTFGLFGHDWRVTPPAAWLDLMAERNVTTSSMDAVPPAPTATTLVLDQSAFADAVKEALSDYPRPDALRDTPLLRSRFVVKEAGLEADTEERIAALRRLIREEAESLEAAPREAKFYRALRATYLDPAPTQEEAAARLDVPFSTYRRHLKQGIEHVTDALWRRETDS
jgi:hypothetical protein